MTVIPDPRDNRPAPARRRVDVTPALEVVGATLVTAFAFIVWWPLALLVAGAFCLVAAWNMSRSGA